VASPLRTYTSIGARDEAESVVEVGEELLIMLGPRAVVEFVGRRTT
jgi:hypothetical protein